MTLHETINELAERFAHDLLRALRTASLEEILTESSSTHARRAARPAARVATRRGRVRRSSADLTKMVDHIIAIVKSSKDGINAEGIRSSLKVARKELPRPIAMALASKKIRKKGEKRATTYYAA